MSRHPPDPQLVCGISQGMFQHCMELHHCTQAFNPMQEAVPSIPSPNSTASGIVPGGVPGECVKCHQCVEKTCPQTIDQEQHGTTGSRD